MASKESASEQIFFNVRQWSGKGELRDIFKSVKWDAREKWWPIGWGIGLWVNKFRFRPWPGHSVEFLGKMLHPHYPLSSQQYTLVPNRLSGTLNKILGGGSGSGLNDDVIAYKVLMSWGNKWKIYILSNCYCQSLLFLYSIHHLTL